MQTQLAERLAPNRPTHVDGVGLAVGAEHGGRAGHLDDLKLAAARVGGRLEDLHVARGALVLGVGLVLGPGDGHDAGADEARHVVHVAVDDLGVARHALPQPDDLLQAQEVLEQLLDALLAQVGVAAGVQQALLSHHEGALAVAVDGAALQVQGALKDGQVVVLQDGAASGVVLVPVGHHGGAALWGWSWNGAGLGVLAGG